METPPSAGFFLSAHRAGGVSLKAREKPLVKMVGGVIVGYAFVIELVDLEGRKGLQESVFSLIEFEGH